jgi:hypothetical protein
VEYRLAAPEGAPERGTVEHVRPDGVHGGVTETCEPRLVPVCDSHGSGLRRKSRDMRADEPGSAGYADRHNLRVGKLFVRSYTPQPTVAQCRYASFPS